MISQVAHMPSGIRRFWFGVSLLSPLRPIPRNDNPLLKLLGKAFAGKQILQRPTPRHLWATDRPRMRYQTCQQLPWCPAHGHSSNMASELKNPVMVVSFCTKKTQTTKKTRGSDTLSEYCCYGNFEGAWINLHARTKLHNPRWVK